ncbi:MAG: aminotransferase class I/II-fold pyridoxal phosphate-dependent enzyme [Firmicutes bacterium]|nr:aminotransferase class I/II-fold pyridoxal phosphate-dependent enzyme [Bacillota bacterium]
MINYENILTDTIQQIPPSGIRKFFDLVSTMDGAISLGVGEPDFVTPWAIREAGIYSLEKGRTYYTANAGLFELRQEISNYNKRKFGIEYNPKNEILVTVGGSEAIDLMIRCLVKPGDEILIPEPSFVCYKPCTIVAGGVPVPIQTREENSFRLLPEQLKEKITDKTKLLILPYPNNPTGSIMSRADLEAIAEVLRGTDIMVLSDEIYGELRYDEEGHTPFSAIDGMRERTVVVNGFSKTFAMTGWRLGYALGPAPIIKAMTKLHQYGIMSSPTTSQFAAIEALKSCDSDVENMVSEYNYRRRFILDGFRNMGLSCFEPLGAFYVFPCIKPLGMTSEEFANRLLEEEKVAVVPGNAFGASGEGFIRCSYAYSIDNIKEALVRIGHFVEHHKKQ